MKEVHVVTLAAQTGLQSSVKALLPVYPCCLSSAPLSLILGEVEESACVPWCFDSSFSSAPPRVSHAFALFLSPWGQWETFPFRYFPCNSGADFVVTKSSVNFLFVAALRSWKTDCSYRSNISLPCFVLCQNTTKILFNLILCHTQHFSLLLLQHDPTMTFFNFPYKGFYSFSFAFECF